MTDTTQAATPTDRVAAGAPEPTIRQRVLAGAQYLDQTDPGWWRLDVERAINLDVLDIDDPCRCVLGQRNGAFWDTAITVDQALRLGFDIPVPDPDDAERIGLAAEWIDVITERRRLAAACCPCRGAVCDPGCKCPSPQCPKTEAEVLDD